jgi:urease accessory protein
MDGAPPSTAAQGVLSGIAHPVIGPDHLLFLVVAGLLMASTRLPTTALFVGMSALGSALHLYGFSLPWSDGLTAATVSEWQAGIHAQEP